MSILLRPEQLAEWFPHQLVVLTEEGAVHGNEAPGPQVVAPVAEPDTLAQGPVAPAAKAEPVTLAQGPVTPAPEPSTSAPVLASPATEVAAPAPAPMVQKPKHSAAAQGTAAPSSPLPFLGKNQKNILVLVRATGVNHLPDAHLDFLVTVLQACQLGLADIALVNLAAQARDWAQLAAACQPKTALLFDVDPAPLGLPFVVPPYRPYAHGGTQFVLLPQLSVYLQADAVQAKSEKKLLWNALKTIFPPQA